MQHLTDITLIVKDKMNGNQIMSKNLEVRPEMPIRNLKQLILHHIGNIPFFLEYSIPNDSIVKDLLDI